MQYEATYLASLIISAIAALSLSPLLFFEQQRSFKPTDSTKIYLVTSILCDVVLLTIPFGIISHPDMSHPVTVRCSAHLVLLILESHGKRNVEKNSQSPEELNGVFSRIFFAWINPILLRGYQSILVDQDLPPLSRDLKPAVTRKAILRAWDQRSLFIPSPSSFYTHFILSQARNEMESASSIIPMSQATISRCCHTSAVLNCLSILSTNSDKTLY